MESDYTKANPVHYFKVDAKHPYRRAVKLCVCMFVTGGSRPNGFILIQWLCVLACWLLLALSGGQRAPERVIQCFLLICMLFKCFVTWHLWVSYITTHLFFWCIRYSNCVNINHFSLLQWGIWLKLEMIFWYYHENYWTKRLFLLQNCTKWNKQHPNWWKQ